MDFTFKGKSWASNIYHQFESICQDVDDFMNQDTAKFVENRVKSVKFFYSNEVSDKLPLSGDTVTSKEQSVDCEQDGGQNHKTSLTDITMEPTHAKTLSINQGSVDTTRNSCASVPTEHDHVSGSPNPDPSHEAKDHLHLSDDKDGIILNDSDMSLKENNTKDTMVVTARSSSRNDVFCLVSGENHMNSMQTVDPLPVRSACETGTSDVDHRQSTLNVDSCPSVSIHKAEVSAIKEETILRSSFSEGAEQTPAVSTSDSAFENKLPMGDVPNSDVEKGLSAPLVTLPGKVHGCVTLLSSSDAAGKTLSNSDENRSVSSPSIAPANEVSELECLTMDSPFPSIRDEADQASGTDGALCESFSSNDDVPISHQSSELSSSYFTEEERKHVMPSTCFTSPESENILESRSEDIIKMAESIHHTHAKTTLSGAVTKTVADVLPAHPISKPEGLSVRNRTWADSHAFWINASDSVVSSSESRHEQLPPIGEPKYSVSSDIGKTYEFGDSAHDPNMETIDLSSGVKNDEKSVVLSNTCIRSASHGRRNFTYYKKLIQDAFTSRKRLSKEYEHLAILYGDIDREASQHFQPSSAPSSPNELIRDLVVHSSQGMCDAEWELL